MTQYTVVEHLKDKSGHLVTFAYRKRSLWDWFTRRAGRQITFEAHTKDGIIWRYFPSMYRVDLNREDDLEDVFERHQLLGKYSDG